MTMPDTARSAGKSADSKCPVCGAGFRGVDACPRCGTNLETVMRIAARAWALRNASRAKLCAGDLAGAIRCSARAWEFQHRGTTVPRLEILLKEKAERSVGVAMPPVTVPPVAISDQHGESEMVSIAGIAKSSGPIVEPHQTASVSDEPEAPRSPQFPAPATPAGDARVPESPWLLRLLRTLTTLKKTIFG
jgi:hypothetical protein